MKLSDFGLELRETAPYLTYGPKISSTEIRVMR